MFMTCAPGMGAKESPRSVWTGGLSCVLGKRYFGFSAENPLKAVALPVRQKTLSVAAAFAPAAASRTYNPG